MKNNKIFNVVDMYVRRVIKWEGCVSCWIEIFEWV